MNFFDKVLNVLKLDESYFTTDGEFLKNAVYEDAISFSKQ